MQRDPKIYDENLHDRFQALSVKQPYAGYLVTAARREGGCTFGKKCIEVRSRNTTFRGDLLICSSASPELPGMMSGAVLGFVELYDVKPLEEFTPEDWENTMIPEEERKGLKGYGWMMRNPRRVIELPVKGQLGIFSIVFDKGEIMEYPGKVVIDRKGWRIIKNRMK